MAGTIKSHNINSGETLDIGILRSSGRITRFGALAGFLTFVPFTASAFPFAEEDNWNILTLSVICMTPILVMSAIHESKSSSGDPSALSENYNYAKDDAAAFIATNGEIRGVQLERALRQFRGSATPKKNNEQIITDHSIASYVLARY